MKYLYILIALFIVGCCDGKKDSTPTQTIPSVTLAIFGSPKTLIAYNEELNFTPIVEYTGDASLSFVITNKPPWGTFNSSTGTLSGTPTCAWLGSYEGIEISVSDGSINSALSVFSIEVVEQRLFSLSGTPSSQAEVDVQYQFQPLLENPEQLLIEFSIENKPSWLDFNMKTGELTGLATSGAVGLYQDIKIKAFCQNVVVELPIFSINVTSLSHFLTSRDLVSPFYGATPPKKGETRVDPSTGAHIRRLTDASELDDSSDALIVYSRYSPENVSGDYVLVFGQNSFSSWIVDQKTGDIINEVKDIEGKGVGESQEVRWHGTSEYPNRIYFVKGMKFWKINDVTKTNSLPELIRDFSTEFPNSTKIYNDVEGDSSNDSDHWAWMAVHYGENELGHMTYLVDAIIHYQVSTNTLHRLTPADLAGTNLDLEKNRDSFSYRPNMVEMSPLGDGVVIHTARKFDDSAYGGKGKDYISTWFDGAHLWPIDFNLNSQAPVKISISETHSGWAFGENNKTLFVSQNNRTDKLDAIYSNGNILGFDNRIEVAEHSDFGWNLGFHYGKVAPSKPGWIFISTYENGNSSWASNQLIMIETKPENEEPKIWRIAPTYNLYQGNYRDEAPAAMNFLGNRVYFSSNWGGKLDHRESFVIELPSNWDEILKD